MKIQYLGTAAAEGIPALFCNCEVCNNARKAGGKDIKTRSQTLLDGKILIDFPADTYMHILRYGLHLDAIHTLVVTHSHSDHFFPEDFWARSHGIAHNIEEKPLNVFVGESGYNYAKSYLEANDVSNDRVTLHKIEKFVPFESEGYLFIPLAADHDKTSDPVIYIIEHDGKSILYAHDTGYFPEETWDFLAKYNKKFDFMSLDCTGMLEPYKYGHMGLASNVEAHERLKSLGVCDDNTVICINHFSHNGKASHEVIEKKAAEYGYITTYDGLTLEI